MVSPELKSFLECCFKRDPHKRANVFELLRHSFINVQVKIQKYTFVLDKIEEETTPVPSNSEYSRKRDLSSSRIGNQSAIDSSANRDKSAGRDKTARSSSDKLEINVQPMQMEESGKKKKRKFFPSANFEGSDLIDKPPN